MSKISLKINDTVFTARLLEEKAPESVKAFKNLLPLKSKVKHVRWSGYAIWVNIDDIELPNLPRENHTVYPSTGDILLYPGYKNEKEILISCGPTCFKSPAGNLAGNHIAIRDASREELDEMEEKTLEVGALDITIENI